MAATVHRSRGRSRGRAGRRAAFSLWGWGVAAIGPERAAPYVHLMPVFGAVLSLLLLGPAQIVGASFVFGGIALVSGQAFRPRSRPA